MGDQHRTALVRIDEDSTATTDKDISESDSSHLKSTPLGVWVLDSSVRVLTAAGQDHDSPPGMELEMMPRVAT